MSDTRKYVRSGDRKVMDVSSIGIWYDSHFVTESSAYGPTEETSFQEHNIPNYGMLLPKLQLISIRQSEKYFEFIEGNMLPDE